MAFGEEGYNPFQAEHAQCNWCGKMVRGPHKDKVFENHNVYAADAERVYSEEEAKSAGKRHNVSGSACPDCYQREMAKIRSGAAHRARVHEQRAAAHQAHKEQEAALTEYNETVLPAERARRAYGERARLSAERVEGKDGLPPGEGQAG